MPAASRSVCEMHLERTDLEGLCYKVRGFYNELASICQLHSGNYSIDLQPLGGCHGFQLAS